MKNKEFTRRDFVKTSAIGATAVQAGCKANDDHPVHDAKVDGAVISMQNQEVMKQNIALFRSFKAMPESEMKDMAVVLEPFYRSENLDWM